MTVLLDFILYKKSNSPNYRWECMFHVTLASIFIIVIYGGTILTTSWCILFNYVYSASCKCKAKSVSSVSILLRTSISPPECKAKNAYALLLEPF
jgi:hypothetical protein